jgi:hypothetical protein
VVVKTTAEDNLIANLALTFANLLCYRWKLNPRSASSVSHLASF